MFKSIRRRIFRILTARENAGYWWRIREKACNGRGIVKYYNVFRWTRNSQRCGAFLPLNTKFEGKPSFPHGFFGVFISSGAVIGKNCTIFHHVTIGSNTLPGTKRPGAPVIGDNVFIGAGAKIIGNVRIGNNVRIGAGCVVVSDVPDNSTVVMPAPIIITHDSPRENRFVTWDNFEQ